MYLSKLLCYERHTHLLHLADDFLVEHALSRVCEWDVDGHDVTAADKIMQIMNPLNAQLFHGRLVFALKVQTLDSESLQAQI